MRNFSLTLESLVIVIVVALCCLVALGLLFDKIWPILLVALAGYLWYKRDKHQREYPTKKCPDCELKDMTKNDL